MANVDYFLKLDGIDGESSDAKHKGEIEILSFSWGASNPSSVGSGGSGGGAGKVSLSDFHFVTKVSKASPQLFLKCCNGKHFPSATISVRRGNAKQGLEFLKITLEDALISSYQSDGSNNEVPIDQVSISYSKITYSYQPQKDDGSLDAAVITGWNIKENTAG